MSNTNILEGYAEVALIAADFKKHPRTIHRWMQQENGLPFVKIGRQRLIHIETAKQWIFDQMRQPNPRRDARGRARP
jgi:hypothetical protein